MLRRALVALALFPAAVHLAHAQMTAAEAFSAGKAAGGESAQTAIKEGLTDAKGSELLQGYDATGASAGAPAYSGGALSILQGAGVGKTEECAAGNAGSTDPRAAQHCAAVNTVMQQANTPPTTLVTIDDPIVTKAQGVIQDPETYAGKFTGITTECAQILVTTPGETREETCEDYSRQLGEVTCTTADNYSVKENYLYKCNETTLNATNASCKEGALIALNPESNYSCNVGLNSNNNIRTCSKKAVIKVENAGSPEWACVSPSTPLYSEQIKSPKYHDKYNFYVYCNSTPHSFRIVMSTTSSKGSQWGIIDLAAVPDDGTKVSGTNNGGTRCVQFEGNASVTCSAGVCSVTMYYNWLSWLIGTNNKCSDKGYPDPLTVTKSVVSPLTEGKPTASITWQSDCGMFE